MSKLDCMRWRARHADLLHPVKAATKAPGEPDEVAAAYGLNVTEAPLVRFQLVAQGP